MTFRRDVRVPNESDGFVFTSARQRGRGISPGDAAWTEAVAGGDVLPLVVESEDDANVRVVIGNLLPDEQEQWVGVVRAGLRVPDGKLVLAGGIEYVMEKAAWAAERSVVVDVPPGVYRATVYCYASAPNGLACVEAAGGEPLGAWFRRTRPGTAMPAWLHDLCVHDPELDPGHQKEWRRARAKAGPPVVDFLLHLEPGELPSVVVADHGFFEPAECRTPALFPPGVAATGLPTPPPAPPEPEPPPPRAAAAGDPPPLGGGPVTLPGAKLVRLARIAWLCHPYTVPVLRLVFPGTPPALEVDGARVQAKGREVVVVFDDTGQPFGAQEALAALGKQLAPSPDGTTFELDLARKAGGPLGRHRYRGVAESGAWRLTHAEPAVDAALLAEALALVESLENGRRLAARDEEEAARIEARAATALADSFGANHLQRTGAEVALKRRDPALFTRLLARAFWMRYAGTWPLQDEDA